MTRRKVRGKYPLRGDQSPLQWRSPSLPGPGRHAVGGEAMTQEHDAVTATVHQGDAAAVLAGLPAASIHCAVTSPPYNGGVRRYPGLDDTQLAVKR